MHQEEPTKSRISHKNVKCSCVLKLCAGDIEIACTLPVLNCDPAAIVPHIHPFQGVKSMRRFFVLQFLYCCFDPLNLHVSADTHTHSHSATPVL